MDNGIKLIDLIIIIIYLMIILTIGLVFSKKKMEGMEFFRGDGKIPWWATAVSISATMLSPLAFLSFVGNAYQGSWLLWFGEIGGLIAIPLVIKFFLPIYARLDIDTAYQYLEIRFGSKFLRMICSILYIIFQLGKMTLFLYLPCVMLSELTNINVDFLILSMGVIATIYSFSGGLKAIIWTDFIQGIILLFGISITLFFIIKGINGGFSEILISLSQDHKFIGVGDHWFNINLLHTSVFMVIVGSCFNSLSTYISSQEIVQRFTTTKNEKHLRKMMLTNGLIEISVATILYLIGTGIFVYYQYHPLIGSGEHDFVFGSYITYVLPAGITGIIIASIYAASQSTIATGLNAIASSWTLDIIDPLIKRDLTPEEKTMFARAISIAVGILALLIASFLARHKLDSTEETFNSLIGLTLGIISSIFILGIVSKYANKYGAIAALIFNVGLVLVIKYNFDSISIWTYTLISMISGLIVGIIVSYIFRKYNHYQYPNNTTIYNTDFNKTLDK